MVLQKIVNEKERKKKKKKTGKVLEEGTWLKLCSQVNTAQKLLEKQSQRMMLGINVSSIRTIIP